MVTSGLGRGYTGIMLMVQHLVQLGYLPRSQGYDGLIEGMWNK